MYLLLKELVVSKNLLPKFGILCKASRADQHKILRGSFILIFFGSYRIQMRFVKKIIALGALNHFHIFGIESLFAVAEFIEKVLAVQIFKVFMVSFVRIKLAGKGHPTVTAIASKIDPLLQFKNLMPIMASERATNA